MRDDMMSLVGKEFKDLPGDVQDAFERMSANVSAVRQHMPNDLEEPDSNMLSEGDLENVERFKKAYLNVSVLFDDSEFFRPLEYSIDAIRDEGLTEDNLNTYRNERGKAMDRADECLGAIFEYGLLAHDVEGDLAQFIEESENSAADSRTALAALVEDLDSMR